MKKFTCKACKYSTEDAYTLDVINELLGECPVCGVEAEAEDFELEGAEA